MNQATRIDPHPTVSVPADNDERWYFFDADGKRTAVAGPFDPLMFVYILRDHDGEPLRRIALTSIEGQEAWIWEKDYIRMPGHLLSAIVHDPEGTGGRATEYSRYFHVDHLGTPRLITGPGGAFAAQHDYLPFGTQTSTTGQDGENPDEALKFTGKKRDFFANPGTKYDLDNFHARLYSPYLGRFLNVDPVSGVGGGSQRTNRYAYVLNNPLKYVDPDGRIVEIANDKRLKTAIAAWKSTPSGAKAFKKLQDASGVYHFSRRDSRLTGIDRKRMEMGQEVTKATNRFTGKYTVGPNGVDWVSGGNVVIDLGVVDSAKSGTYAGEHGDAAIVAHEGGHADHYEDNPEGFVALEYEEQEEVADEHRDAVVEELEVAENQS